MAVARNPKDSMKSTWIHDPSTWTRHHWMLSNMGVHPVPNDRPVPVFAKTEKVPILTEWSCQLFILAHALWPMLLQYAYYSYFGHNIHPVATFVLYLVAFNVNAMKQARIAKDLGHQYGYLDGDKHERDMVPDVGVAKVLHSVELTTSVRTLFTVFLTYRSAQAPALTWWLPAELFMYSIVLDFWFYWYHRCCHEYDGLWKYHRTHHLTKHPSPLLSAYADAEQEVIEIMIVPLLTWGTLKLLGFPMGFYDWWICHQYLVFSESIGHSGLRMYAQPPGLSNPILSLFGAELVIEDHDLHHRKGWRHSYNYGKQTRFWDRLFGTCHDRIESPVENVDFSKRVNFPLL